MPGSQNAEFGARQTPLANPRGYRDKVTGRFARRPVEDIDAESRFDPMADAAEDIDDVSGAPSANTIERPRHMPAGDTLAGEGPSYGSSPLRARNPVLVHPDDADRGQGAVLRSAARDSGPDDPTSYLVGLETNGTLGNMVVENG